MRFFSVMLMIALITSMLGQNPAAAGPLPPEEPPAEYSDIAQQIPTTFVSDEDLPTLGDVTSDGAVVVEDSPAEVSLSLDPATGATIVDQEGTSFTVAPNIAADGGIAGDHVVVYNYDGEGSDGETDLAMRPTSDGGVEGNHRIPAGETTSAWTVTTDEPGASLQALGNGLVAVIDPDGVPDPEIVEAATALTDALDTMRQAALEDVVAAYRDDLTTDDLVQATKLSPLSTDLVAAQEASEEPPLEEVVEEDGTLPVYLQENVDIETLTAAVGDLAAQVDPADYTEDERALLASAEAELDAAEAALELSEQSLDLELQAAMIEENHEILTEALDEVMLEDIADEMTAELDLADSDAELERAAEAIVEAQAEVGDAGRVIGVFAAPMTKTESGEPISTSLEVVDAQTVVVHVPDTGESVVVDPFFIPVAIFIVQNLARLAAQQAIRAAAQYAARRAAMKVAQEAARIAAKKAAIKAQQVALRAAAQARARLAREALQRAMAQAALRAQQRAAQFAAQAARARKLGAQAVKAKNKAIKAGKAKRTQTGKASNGAKAKKSRSLKRGVRSTSRAKRTLTQTVKEKIDASIKKIQTGTRPLQQGTQQIKDATLGAVKRVEPWLYNETVQEVGEVLITEAAVEYMTGQIAGDSTEESCLKAATIGLGRPPGMIGIAGMLVFDADDVWGCLVGTWNEIAATDQPTSEGDDNGAASELDDLRGTAELLYQDASATARDLALTFAPAGAGLPVGVRVDKVLVANRIAAPSRATVLIGATNVGPALSLSNMQLRLDQPMPWLISGAVGTDPTRLRLVDENGDNKWSYTERVIAIAVLDVPKVVSQTRSFQFAITNDGVALPGGQGSVTLNVAGPAAPAAPALTATSGRSGQVPMTWTAPGSDPNDPVTHYQVQRIDNSETRTVTTRSLTWTGLSNGTTYNFKVRACSSLQCGGWSASKSAKPYGVPGMVGTPSISSQYNALRTTWGAAATNGSTITSYQVQGSKTATVSGSARSYTHTVGQDGGKKRYQVRACNAAGCGSWSSYSGYLRAKVIAMTKGGAAPYGYWYSARVYGPPGWAPTIGCEGPQSGVWWSQTATLSSDGYYSDTTLCYSGYRGDHWVSSGSLTSNRVNW